jgi:asparagine synthase (glutamine-hydrolysing)
VCGICGILEDGAPDGTRRRRVERMTAALEHRGPDDEGRFEDERISLGFRRLSVIDLATGGQPIRLEDDRAVIVLNGEIYNYRELRKDLERRQTFRTKGDVEVVLRLYAEKGIDALADLRGMFALAIWDRRLRTLFLARDRFGIKPLFVHRAPGTLAFASEVGALLAGGVPARPALDRAELRHYLAQRYPSPSGSILEGVASLPPATVLEVSSSGTRQRRYWEAPSGVARDVSERDALEALGAALRGAVRRQLVADVPLGVFLSGGLDSSTLTALVRECEPAALRTFAVGFEGKGARSELPFAREVARRLGTEHAELVMDPGAVAADLDAILGALDGPLGDPTAIPTWYLSRHARTRVTVALSGEGADEMFGGYPRQRLDAAIDRIGPVGRRLAPAALRAMGRPASPRLRERLGMKPTLSRQLHWSCVFLPEEIDALSLDPLPDEQDEALARGFEEAVRRDPVNARLATDRELYLPGDLLPKVDRMSMAHSLEVRVPYLDEDVADLVLRLPGRMKVRGLQGKVLLRRVAASLLPREIVERKKHGFDVPIGEWLRGSLAPAMRDLLSEAATRRRGLFHPEAVAALVRGHLSGERDHGEALFTLLALEGWQQRVLDRAAVVPAS